MSKVRPMVMSKEQAVKVALNYRDLYEQAQSRVLALEAREKELEAKIASTDDQNKQAFLLIGENARLKADVNGLQSHVRNMKAAVDAARSLHGNVGDGDNGPVPWLIDDWNELDKAFRELDGKDK